MFPWKKLQHGRSTKEPDRDYPSEAMAEIEAKRQALIAAGEYSVPRHLGKLVIVVSGMSKQGYDSQDHQEFIREALLLAEERRREGHYAEVVVDERPTREQILAYVADRSIAGMGFVGHGTFERMFTEGSRRDISYHDIHGATTHLKHSVEQRMCGHRPELVDFAIPLGIPMVADPTNIYAAPGMLLPDEPVESNVFQPVFAGDRPWQEQLRSLNAGVLSRIVEVDIHGVPVDGK